MRKSIHERIIKLKSQPRWVVRCFIALGIVLGGIFAFISHPIGGTNAQTPSTATLKSGQEFNVALKRLVPGNEWISSCYDYDNTIMHIERSSTEPESWVETQRISADSSENEVVAWYDEDSQTIYYYSESDTIYLNEDSSIMVGRMQSLETIDMSGWDTSRVTNMGRMFFDCYELTELDLSNWDISNVTNAWDMFEKGYNLETIYVGEGFSTNHVSHSSKMFDDTYKLIGGNGTKWNDSYTDYTYAKIDNQSQSGYFTAKEGNIRVNFIVDGDVWSTQLVEYGHTVDRPSPDPVKEGTEFRRWIDKNGTEFDFETREIDRYTEIYAAFDEAILKPGQEFNVAIKTLVPGNEGMSDYNGYDSNIKHIVKSDTEPESWVETQRISADSSENEVVAWYDEDSQTIYYYSEKDTIYLNEDSSYMFFYMNSLETIDMSGWDTIRVTNMHSMFMFCHNLIELDLSNWNTSHVINIGDMFYDCQSLTELDLSNWDTSRVTNMGRMFYNSHKLETIYIGEGFNTDQVSYSYGFYVFDNAYKLIGGNGTKWNDSYTDYTYAKIDNQSQSGYFTDKDYITVNFIINGEILSSQVVEYGGTVEEPNTNTIEGFKKRVDKNGREINFNTTRIERYTEIYGKIASDEAILKLGQEFRDTVNSLSSRSTIKSIVRSETAPEERVTTEIISSSMSNNDVLAWYDEDNYTIYYYTEASKIYLNEDSSYMFSNMNSLETIEMSGWDTSNVTNMSYMFYDCNNLTELDLSSWDTSKVTNMSYMFERCYNLETIYVGEGFEIEQVNSSDTMFSNSWDSMKLVGGNGTKWAQSNPTDKTYAKIDNSEQSGYFTDKNNITVNFIINGEIWDSQIVEFGGTMEEPNINIEGFKKRVDKNGREIDFNTTRIERYTEIYGKVESDEAILLPGQEFKGKLSNLADYRDIHQIVRSETAPEERVTTEIISSSMSNNDVLAWYDEDNYTIYYYTEASKIYLNEDSSWMFYNMQRLETIDMSGWDTSKVTNMYEMFYDCQSLTELDLSNWDISNVTNIGDMFYDCQSLTELDLSSWDTSNVTDMYRMFYYCGKLETIYVGENFTTDEVYNDRGMFYYDNKLIGGNGTKWNQSNPTDKTYAKIDNSEQSGYFTSKEGNITVNFIINGEILSSQVVEYGGMVEEPNTNTIEGFKKRVDKNGRDIDFNTTRIERYTEIYGKVESDEATLLPGQEFKGKLSNLADYRDIHQIVKSETAPEERVTTEIISSSMSNNDVLAWYDEDNYTIYYYTEASKIYLNEDSSLMFYNMSSLETIEMSGWDTSRVTNMQGMFNDCNNLTELDLSNWDTSNVTNMQEMFNYCNNLETIYVGSLFNTDNVPLCERYRYEYDYCEEPMYLFYNNTKLVGGNGTRYSNSYRDKTYARIDIEDEPGYFTDKNIISLKFIVNGAIWGSETVEFGESIAEPTEIPTKDGATFKERVDKNGVKFDFEKGIEKYTEIYARFDSNEAVLLPGKEFRNAIIGLAGSNYSIYNITRSPLQPQEGTMIEVITVPYSDNEVVAWYDANKSTIYYYVPEGVTVYLNEYSDNMFYNLYSLRTVDLSDWDSSRVKYAFNVFAKDGNLQTIYANRSFSTDQIINSIEMFGGYCEDWDDECYRPRDLQGGNGTRWSSSYTDVEYARIDTEDEPGYFTYKDLEEAVSISFYDGSELLYSGYMVSGHTVSESNLGKFSTYPSKVGNIFDGWYEENAEDKFDLRHTPVGEDLNLYARWVVFQREDITICDPEDSGACITMMDRNLGATVAGVGCNSFNCSEDRWSSEYDYDSYEDCISDVDRYNWEMYYSSESDCEENDDADRCGNKKYEYNGYESPDDMCGGGNYGEFDSYEACEQGYNECMNDNEGVYGYHYQWGRNVGFDSRTEDISTTKLRAVWDPSYNNYGYLGSDSFILGEYTVCWWDSEFGSECDIDMEEDYRENDEHYDGLRGGAEDSIENNWGYDAENHTATNVEGRQGPCPEGYHVPSIGEWNTVLDYWIKENKDPEKIVWNDGLIGGYYEGYNRVCYKNIIDYDDCWYGDGDCIDEDEYGDCYEYEQVEYCYNYNIEIPCDGDYDGDDFEYMTDKNIGREFQESFNIPFAGYRDANADIKSVGFGTYLWSSSPYVVNSYARHFSFEKSQIYTNSSYDRVRALSLRCFKNVADVPEQQNTGSTTTGSTTTGSTTEPTTGGGGSSAGGSHGGGNTGGSQGGGGGGGGDSNNKPTTQDPEIIVDPDATVDGNNSAGEFVYDSLKANPNYSDEMNEAYQYAYHYGITTMESVKEADMGGSLTRIAMAKMLSNYAINVLGKDNFDESRDCGFVDVSSMMNIEYDNGITNACKLGIMGINMPNGKFRPNDPVTRAEFVTALSRMKYNTPDGEDTYYSTHMKLLNRLGVITNTDPTMKELRGYVMIMLMRAK